MSTANVSSKWLKERNYEPFYITFIKYQGMTTISLLHVMYLGIIKKEDVTSSIWPPCKGDNLSNNIFLFVSDFNGCCSGTILRES